LIGRPKRGGSQRILDTGPICRRQRLPDALDGKKGADMNSRSAGHHRSELPGKSWPGHTSLATTQEQGDTAVKRNVMKLI
jgi:hypothetical protein